MKRSLLALAVASLVFAAAASAKPIANFGGCGYNTPLEPGSIYAQTFKPTFSVLKKARFVLFGSESSSEDTMFMMVLKTPVGATVATSDYEILAAGTSHDDAAAGDALTFTFQRSARVTPGVSYVLELVRVGGTSPIWACTTFQSYADGVMLTNGAWQMDWDLEFGVKGSGPGK
jgi:hypothetical protein